jgi:molybdenum cofactor biosynthesis protein MoaC
MVDVTEKKVTKRSATARGRISIPLVAYKLVTEHTGPETDDSQKKGDVLAVAQLAAIMGCKKTSELIPLCHPLPLTHVSVKLIPESLSNGTDRAAHSIVCQATVSCEGKTGVEMEALTAVSIGLLTVWDMLKAVAGKEMQICDIMVVHKEGGRSGNFRRHCNKS